MQFATLLLILLPLANADNSYCSNGFALTGSKCLRFFSSPASHTSAEKVCTSYGGTIATIKNSIENRAIASLIGTAVSQVWVGLSCIGNSSASCYWNDDSGSTETYSNFARNFPNTDIGSCAYYVVTGTLAGQWVSAACEDEQNPFVCELPTTVYDSYCAYNYNGYCYIPSYTFYHELLPVNGAQQVCQMYGFEFAWINSTNEIRFIKTIPLAQSIVGYSFGGQQYLTNSSYIRTASTVEDNFLCKRLAGPQYYSTVIPATVPTPFNAQSCNAAVMAPGAIISPGYPQQYTNSLNCPYLIAATGLNRISLSFTAFLTESCCDRVSVYDGDSVNSPLLATLSGSPNLPIVFQSTGNRLYVVFTTDASVVYTGFMATITPII